MPAERCSSVYDSRLAENLNQMPTPRADEPPPRIQILGVWPQVDCGRFPVKRTVGDPVHVWADVFRDGHETLGAAVRFKAPGGKWQEAPLRPLGNDRWAGSFEVDRCGRYSFRIAAWHDRIASWQDELRRKVEAGQKELASELAEGALLLSRDELTAEEALDSRIEDRHALTESPELEVDVDRERARFGAWYELFPRSWGGFAGVEKILPELAELGFDVLYLPPIHPIGATNRKGRNNSLDPKPGDPGSPWAIGGPDGGHDAIHPELGTLAEFDRMVARARALGLDVALDFAIQTSPDHPWLTEHPEWFQRRPDGTIKYAENPPKKYQDIHNVDWESEDWKGLWEALRDVVLHWCGHGVRVFRVDNPHTKPVPFWEWLIEEVRSKYPETVFLAEAFTAPALMTTLAKAGFSQSYTYFTWKNSKADLLDFVSQLLEWSEFYRPNLFTNTPDILHAYLQHGGRPAFEARLVLAATLSPTYGIYSGYESCENVPVREGSEEYLDSEKYEAKERQLDGVLLPLVKRLNEIRRAEPALQRLDNVRFLETASEQLLAYLKGDELIVVVNLDPTAPQEGLCILPVQLGLPPAFMVEDLLTGERHPWRIGRNYVGLDPDRSHVLKVVHGV
jgi:starch synthase (maltosyl-transferring)